MTKITLATGKEICISYKDRPINLQVLNDDEALLKEIAEIVHGLHDPAGEEITSLTFENGVIKFFRHFGERNIPMSLNCFPKQLLDDLKNLELAIMQNWDRLFPVCMGVR